MPTATDPLLGTSAPSARTDDSPAPKWLRWLARLASASLVVVMFVWVFKYLGGVSLSPKVTAEGANDTGVIFNWHPLLMAIAFPVLMGEAVLAYKAPIIGGDSQPRCGFGMPLVGKHFLLFPSSKATLLNNADGSCLTRAMLLSTRPHFT